MSALSARTVVAGSKVLYESGPLLHRDSTANRGSDGCSDIITIYDIDDGETIVSALGEIERPTPTVAVQATESDSGLFGLRVYGVEADGDPAIGLCGKRTFGAKPRAVLAPTDGDPSEVDLIGLDVADEAAERQPELEDQRHRVRPLAERR